MFKFSLLVLALSLTLVSCNKKEEAPAEAAPAVEAAPAEMPAEAAPAEAAPAEMPAEAAPAEAAPAQ
jgi:hypothetical protein